MKNMILLPIVITLLLISGRPAWAQEFQNITEEYPELTLPILETKTFPASPVRIFLECSPTVPRGVDAVVEWVESQKSVSDYRLDVTVFKNGFSEEWYATLWPIRERNRTRLINPEKLRGQRTIAGLDLQVAGLSVEKDAAGPSLRLSGLEPGKNYFWRILKRDRKGWIAGEVIRLQAPVCPADFIERN